MLARDHWSRILQLGGSDQFELARITPLSIEVEDLDDEEPTGEVILEYRAKFTGAAASNALQVMDGWVPLDPDMTVDESKTPISEQLNAVLGGGLQPPVSLEELHLHEPISIAELERLQAASVDDHAGRRDAEEITELAELRSRKQALNARRLSRPPGPYLWESGCCQSSRRASA